MTLAPSVLSRRLRPLVRPAAVLSLALATACGGAGPTGAGSSSGASADVGGGGGNDPNMPGSGTATPPAPTPTTSGTSSSGTPHAAHVHCGWIGADTAGPGTATFVANPDYFDAIHPKWFTLNPDGSPRSIAFTDDKTVTDTAHAHHVQLIPLIDYDDASYIRNVFNSGGIAQHVQQLVDLVVQHNYDGIELDYEHLWNASDRAPYTQLVQQAAAALHQKGKVLTLALPAMDHDDTRNAYDYAALNAAADVMHLMAYDFHYLGGDHLGPIAPLGWVTDVANRAKTIGDPKKYVVAVANYAIGPGWYGTVAAALQRCGGQVEGSTDHMNSCPYGDRAAGRSPHCSGANIWWEDPASVGEKASAIKQAGLGGVGYWTVGSEPQGFFEAIKALYP